MNQGKDETSSKKGQKMNRRQALKTVGIGAAAATGVIAGAPAVHAKKRYQWKMVTTWGPNMPYLQTETEAWAKMVDKMSDGRLKIKVYAANELVPAFGVFDAVSSGTYHAFHCTPYFWAGKVPASQWFACVPFGLNAQGMNAWHFHGGGLQLWEEAYRPFNLIPRVAGNCGFQMGGWFRRKIETMNDYKGLKMRIPGLGGKVVAKAGGTVTLTAPPEIFTSLERGVIDAAEFVGPLLDMKMGLYKAAPYYYYPGWHEPGSVSEATFNADAYNSLPKDLQALIDYSTQTLNFRMLTGFEADNAVALRKLIEVYKVKVKAFPTKVLQGLKVLADEVLEEEAAKDPMAKKTHESFKKFRDRIGPWSVVSEKAFYDHLLRDYKI